MMSTQASFFVCYGLSATRLDCLVKTAITAVPTNFQIPNLMMCIHYAAKIIWLGLLLGKIASLPPKQSHALAACS